MKLKYLICAVALGSIALNSCSEQMDYHEYSIVSKEYISKNFPTVAGFVVRLYNDLDYDLGQMYGGASLCSATDEAVYSHQGSKIESFYDGSWSPINPNATLWYSCLDGIKYSNLMLDEFSGLKFEDFQDKNYLAEMLRYKNYQWESRFFRAYYHFLLLRQYGNIPLMTKSMDPEEANNVAQVPADDVFKFIDDECNIVKDSIVKEYAGAFINLEDQSGRVNNLGVLALRARAALYHASPLFTQGKSDAEIKELWHQAALRSKECLDTCAARGMRLCDDYSKLFTAESWKDSEALKEVIFARRNSADRAFEIRNFPIGMANGQGGNCPTENLVSAYETTNGLPISQDPDYDPQNPYANRDSRLEATVAVNGEHWPDALSNDAEVGLEIWYGGVNSRSVMYGTPTGYYLKKYLNRTTIISGNQANSAYHTWILFRIGQVYLDYAEAMLNYTGSGYATAEDLPMSAADAINMVRNRAEQPDLPAGLDFDEFWERYQNERFVELAFEGHRFYDVRRWMLGAKYFENIRVMEVTKDEDGNINYSVVTNPVYITARKWAGDFQNFFPIPQADVLKSGQLQQTPGW